jgi:hypothetical protein
MMDYREEAEKLLKSLPHIDCCGGDYCYEPKTEKERWSDATTLVANALKTAVEEEREACAKLAYKHCTACDRGHSNIHDCEGASAIRARGGKE